MRIADINARLMTDVGGNRMKERKSGLLHWTTASMDELTDLPRFRTHVCPNIAINLLHSEIESKLVPPNDIDKLQSVFKEAEANNAFIELVAMEPVMGEGNFSITRDFYDTARKLSNVHGSFLLIDSIQAGLRGQGCLSIVDYPGFEDCEVPDFETWSKALNAGQYPLSIGYE